MVVMRWASEDKRFTVVINHSILTGIAYNCKKAKGVETGGVLVGRYIENLYVAVVTEATPPPSDSKSSPVRFKRGIAGLRKLFLERWISTQRTYYIGEWHYHPADIITPSPDDLDQMVKFSYSEEYDCFAPIMLIAGIGKEINRPYRIFAFPRDKHFIELFPES